MLLLDEPTASLDPEIAVYIREFLLEERKKYNISILFTSHNMPEVEEVCDRVIFINHGKIVADDTPSNLAKKIKITHVRLRLIKEIDKAIDFAKKQKIKHSKDDNIVIFDIREDKVSDFLSDLSSMGVVYSEISIDKPTLEDFFLQMAKDKENKDPLKYAL